MSTSKKGSRPRNAIDPQELREQEVLRANRELAAYFKGRRTEREARAALKIVKAFIRDREHVDPARRRPLPGTAPAPVPKKTRARKPASAVKGRQKKSSIPPRTPARDSSVVPPDPAPATNGEDA
jgi:hypothetical protein